MRQATMIRPGQIAFTDVPAPTPAPGQVLLRTTRIGVSGSDVHVNHGRHPFTAYPVVQGHEYSAVIEAVGAGVEALHPGQKATARPQLVCGTCRSCARGDDNICDHLKVEGFQAPGCACDLFAVDADRVVLLPEALTFDQGALVEPVAVAVHATGRAGALVEGANVVVLGAGPIGNFVAQLARCRGAAKVLITDLSDYRLAKARECGIAATANAGEESLADAARRVFGADGFDLAFEAVGVEATMDAAVAGIRKGGVIVVLGVFGKRPHIDMAVVGDHELSLVGTLMYKHEDYVRAVQLIDSEQVVTTPLISRHFDFDAYPDAYRFIDDQGDKVMKVMIDL